MDFDGFVGAASARALANADASTAPMVVSITPSTAGPTNAGQITETVVFSEAVTGVDFTDFTLTSSGTAYAAIAGVTGSGTTYTVTLTNLMGDGTLRLDLRDSATGIQDTDGNPAGGFTSGGTVTLDHTAPTGTATAGSAAANASSVNFSVHFSEAVTGVDAGDFVVDRSAGAYGFVTRVSGSGLDYTVNVSGIFGTGSLSLAIAPGATVTDLAGNPIYGFSSSETHAVDRDAPTATSVAESSAPNSISTTYTVHFSEAVINADPADFTLSTTGTATGTVTGVTGSGQDYQVTVSGIAGAGSLALGFVQGATLTDAAGNPATFTSSQAHNVDREGPTATSLRDASAANAASTTFAVHFNEGAAGVDAADFALSATGTAGGEITGVTGSGQDYVVTVSGITGTGSLALALAQGATITDALGNASSGFTSSQAHAVDRDGPTATSTPDSSAANAASTTFAVHFNEGATGVEAADFALSATGTAGGTITDVTGSGQDYFVTVSGITGTGSLALALAQGAAFTDAVSNVGAELTSSQAHIVDRDAPIVSSVSASGGDIVAGSGTVTAGQTLSLTLEMSEAVTVASGSGLSLGLSSGGVAVYDASLSDATHLVFTHTVAIDEVAADLAIASIDLGGAAVADAAGNLALLTGALINPVGTLRIDGYTGTPGDDTFHGTPGAETFRGLAGDDIYYVDNVNDVVLENRGDGDDTVRSSVSYALAAGQEIEHLTTTDAAGSDAIDLTGNDLDNEIVGNAGVNNLFGGGGADTLVGLGGNDRYYVDSPDDVIVEQAGGGDDRVYTTSDYTLSANVEQIVVYGAGNAGVALTGNAGDNVFFGGTGDDTLTGLGGNDRYFVSAGDTVVEAHASSGGFDSVFTKSDFTLSDGVEAIHVFGTTAGLALTGNGLANALYGGDGADTLAGGGGNDKYFVGAGDTVVEGVGAGKDTVYTTADFTLSDNVENLQVFGKSPGLALTGNAGINVIIGGVGADTISGGGGADVLIGGRGADTFDFSALSDSTIGSYDRIGDFVSGTDHIDLTGLEASSGQPLSWIGDAAFSGVAGELHAITRGAFTLVEADVDGNGKADFRIVLTNGAAVAEHDFLL